MTHDEIKVLILLSGKTQLSSEVEEEIFENDELARLYMSNILPADIKFSKSICYVCIMYAKWTLYAPWPAAEKFIKKDAYWYRHYLENFPDRLQTDK